MMTVQMFLLIFLRITSFVVICPVFSNRGVPQLAKVVLTACLTVGVFPFVDIPEMEVTNLALILMSLKEVLLGMTMSYIGQLVFTAIEMAGQMIDFQVGFSMGQAYDPSFQTMSSQFGKLYYWIAMAVVFILDLHHLLIKGLVLSFTLVPLGSFLLQSKDIEGIVTLFGKSFEVALNLAAPMIIAVLVIDLTLGIISRSIPQLNVLMLGLPIKTMVSFAIFLVLAPNVMNFLGKQMPENLGFLLKFIRSIPNR